MKRALGEYVIKGIKTTIPFHQRVMNNEKFLAGDIHTGFIEDELIMETADEAADLKNVALVAAALHLQRKSREGVGTAGPVKTGTDAWKMMGRRSRWVT